ncbi:MAG: hypothetical protein OXU42_13330 [Deltaproteobacteria bacterium]|nr:hypothetical protein [Deltaproteobacteria bacterium]
MNVFRGIGYKTIKSVASPLHFFALLIILLATIIVGLAWKSTLPPDVTVRIIYVAAGMLLFVVVLVAFLIVFFPQKLTFDRETHLAVLRERLGDSELPTPYQPKELSKRAAPREITREEDAS